MTCGKKCKVDRATGCPIGAPLFWPQACISYSMQYEASKQVDLESATAVAQQAFTAWQDVSCPGGGSPSIGVSNAFGPVACKLHEYNKLDGNANIILFHDDEWPFTADEDAIAVTTVTYDLKSGEIFDADIEVNGTETLSTGASVDSGAFDLRSVLTHEAGHFLGLAHSPRNPDATMWPYYDPSAFDLDPDDINGICNVYPPSDAPNACDFTPRQGFSPECGIDPSTVSCAFARASKRPARCEGALYLLAALACVRLLRTRATRARARRRPDMHNGATGRIWAPTEDAAVHGSGPLAHRKAAG